MPDAAAVVLVVTWKGVDLLPACLDALRAQTSSIPFETWVVDNGSRDGTAELLAQDYPEVRVLRSTRNLGFTGGCNLGLREVTAPFAILLNDDARPEPAFVEQILSGFDRVDVAAVTGKILLAARYARSGDSRLVQVADDDPAGRDVINSTGTSAARNGAGFDRNWLDFDDAVDAPREVFGFCGGAAALRMAALHRVGYFEADYFLYYEDLDLSWRLRAAGYSIVYEPTAVVRHLHAQSSDETSPRFRYFNDRNALLTFTRHAPMATALFVIARYPVAFASHAITELPQTALTRARARAFGAFLKRLPLTWRDRQRLWANAVRTRSAVMAGFERRAPRERRA